MLRGPIFLYEMLTTGRRVRYLLLRVAYAALLFFLLFTTHENFSVRHRVFMPQGIQNDANVASEFFHVMAMAQILAIFFIGPAIAAGSVAVERDRRTIEYLFATDLTNSEIVLGKLFARLAQLSCFLLAGAPILAIAMLMGGIGPERLAQVFVISLSTMILVTTLSIGVSVCATQARNAVVLTYVCLLFLFFFPVVAGAIVRNGLARSVQWMGPIVSPIVDVFLAANPVFVIDQIMYPARMGGAASPWLATWRLVGLEFAFSAVVAWAAVRWVRSVHLNAVQAASPKRKSEPRSRWRRGLGDNAMLWKEMYVESRRHTGRWTTVLGKGIGILLIVGGPILLWMHEFSGQNLRDNDAFAAGAATTISCLSLLFIAARASGLVTLEKEKDTWVTLLSTPLSPREIVLSKILANLYVFRVILFLVLVCWGIEIAHAAVALRSPVARFWDQDAVYAAIIGCLACMTTTLILGWFASALGVMYSLRSKNSTRSIGAALVTLFFIGGGYMLCVIPFVNGHNPSDQLFLSGVVPFLMMEPYALMLRKVDDSRQAWNLLALVVGNGGYFLLAMFLFRGLVDRFQKATGRLESE